MRLLKTYRGFTYTTLCVVVLFGAIFNYYLFRYSIHRTTDDVLNEYRLDIEEYAVHHGTLQPLMAVNSKFGEIVPLDPFFDVAEIDAAIVDTLVYSHYQEEMVLYRKLVFPIVTPYQNYKVQLLLPALEEDDLVQTVVISLLLFVVLFILMTTITDMAFNRQIFRPFHRILELIKAYDIDKRSKITFEASAIDEFKELGRILTEMTEKINAGYYEMKEFLEYTSHEIQTPLAIIQLKLDVLNQQNFQNKEVLDSLYSMQSSLNCVVRFNRSILFLTKVRNNQFTKNKKIDLRANFLHQLQGYEELLSMRNIRFFQDSEQPFVLHLHPLLAEHLVQNILTNAIKHNYDGGWIRIGITDDKMVVTNTFDGVMPHGDIFEKYTHGYDKTSSTGLGLSIVKAICEKNDIGFSYRISENEFSLTILKNVKG